MSSFLLLAPGRAIIGNPLYLVAVCGMFVSMVGLWKLVDNRRVFYLLIALGIVVRVVTIVQFPEGDDLYRYIWEGRIQLEGFNPFELPPDSEELVHLRNDLWKDINHKHIPAIYWPFAQQLFKLAAKISPTVIFFKSLLAFFDLLTLLVILLLARTFGIEKRHALLYALNPLVIIYIAGEGHLESIPVFWVTLSLLFLQKKRFALMYLAFGFALMTKFNPVVFLPFLIRRENARYLFMILLPCLIMLPYLQSDTSLLWVPKMFTTEFRFNGLLYTVVNNFFSTQITFYICVFISFCLGMGVILLTPDPFRSVALATGILLFCTPIMHPWYLLMMTSFLVFYRSWPWLILHLTILPLIFYFRPALPETSFWRDKTLLMSVEYVPFVLVGLWWMFKYIRRWPVIYRQPETLSVVVPVLNEENNITRCLEAITSQSVPMEIVVVDGGSTDNTPKMALSFKNVKVLTSDPGRGIQVKKGIENSSGDVIVIVHADSQLRANALEKVLQSLRDNPDAAGGSISAQYENAKTAFRFTEVLNNLRALWTGISFGDQAQFFRKEVIGDTFPPYRIMEDIELSFRIKEKGALLFLPKGVISSTRGWKKRGYMNNFFKVIFLSSLFIVMRKLGLIRNNCERFYRAYYGTK